ncbi:MAG: DNA polymerase III subunit epsilon [Alphaproteobacteria bacterium]|nr:DNA polymerase III subunit epsilon [Alphaproteobacteria bacterium]
MREIVLDTETTGLDPYSGHRVVEIGCVELINHIRTGNHFQTYLNPERDMPPEAERVHGLSSSFLSDKPLFKTIAASFLEFIGDSPLVIHNAAFDMKFINAELESAGFAALDMSRALDTVLMARQKFPGQPASLDALCKRFNIDLSTRTKHGALLDSELLADVYLELRGGRQAVLSLKEEETRSNDEIDLAFTGHTDIPTRHFPPTAEELAAHRTMLEKLKNPIWSAA